MKLRSNKLLGPEGQYPTWEELYASEPVEELPWYWELLDKDVARAIEDYPPPGKEVLDLGSGPGTQAAILAAKGWKVTASDLSASAVKEATRRHAGHTIRFVVDDILRSALSGPFDLIVDRGCFHVLNPESRSVYRQQVKQLLAPEGLLYLKTFHYRESFGGGPHRFSPEDIESIFGGEFRICHSVETEFEGTLETSPLALFTVLAKV
ncbi:MAG: class I SAM-dependent methyltransferase [Magnetococcales bacterium]|nr:class I SAM-dependent methyltransferase [Magnetococcales bacterium]